MSKAIQPIFERIAEKLKMEKDEISTFMEVFFENDATLSWVLRHGAFQNDPSFRKMLTVKEMLQDEKSLIKRREEIVSALKEQNVLTETLLSELNNASSREALEDCYLPYRPMSGLTLKAAEEGLLSIEKEILNASSETSLESLIAPFLNEEKGIDSDVALAWLRQLLTDRFLKASSLIKEIRERAWSHGVLKVTLLTTDKEKIKSIPERWLLTEPLKNISKERAMFLFRARREGLLKLNLVMADDIAGEEIISRSFGIDQKSAHPWLLETMEVAWRTKIWPKIEWLLLLRLREWALKKVITEKTHLFRYVLNAPSVEGPIMALYPESSASMAVVSIAKDGALLNHADVPLENEHDAMISLAKLVFKCDARIVVIGLGRGFREATRIVSTLMKTYPDLALSRTLISPAGASAFATSKKTVEDFPNLSTACRGAFFIGQRFVYPLSAFAMIKETSFFSEDEQKELDQGWFENALDAVFEEHLFHEGVDLNRASSHLLSRVFGIDDALAREIVQHREEHGIYKNREALKNLSLMTPQSFEQSAGFLKIFQGDEPLDTTFVHPKDYSLARELLKEIPKMEDRKALRLLNPQDFVNEEHSISSVKQVLRALNASFSRKRPFRMPLFSSTVETPNALTKGMTLEGIVTNVTSFGAFVDVGVHQDGLIHLSSLKKVLRRELMPLLMPGELVSVVVSEVDLIKKRISLELLSVPAFQEDAFLREKKKETSRPKKEPVEKKKEAFRKVEATPKKVFQKPLKKKEEPKKAAFNSAMADAFLKLKNKP